MTGDHPAQPLPEPDAALRERLRRDPHRPCYHFLPPANWMNDPNGLIQWRGQYHLFYQHHPYGPLWANMHWGHAVSPDLVHWQHRPIALAPTPGSPDQDGCFSGCAVDDGGVPTLVYTGVRGQDQLVCLATGDDDLLTWRKHPRNPVIPAPPPDLDLVAYRDPSVWREGDWWCMVHGAGIRGAGGAALLYRSHNLVDWEYRGPVHVGDAQRREPVWTGALWECPQLFPLADRHVLIVSVWDNGTPHYAAAMVGAYAGEIFTPATAAVLDAGALYAPQTMRDDAGRRILFGWLREGRSREAMQAAGWSGVMSLPRHLSLRPDGTLGYAPVPELQRLRRAHHHVADLAIQPGTAVPLDGLGGDCLEVVAVIEPGEAAACGLVVRCAPDGEEQTRIVYEPAAGRLLVDRARSSTDPTVDRTLHAAALALGTGEPLRLHVFLDRSVVEVFANGRVCLSERIYPTRADSRGLGLVAAGGVARLAELDVWELASVWDDGA